MKTAGIIKIVTGCVVLVILLVIGAGMLTGGNALRRDWWESGKIEAKLPDATATPLQPASADAPKTESAAEAPKAQDGAASAPAAETSVGDIRYAAADVRNIEATWVAGHVEIVVGTGDEIILSETCDEALSSDQQMRCRLSGGKLVIDYCREIKDVWHWFSIGNSVMPAKELLITLPASLSAAFEELEINTVSAGLRITGLDCRELSVSTTSGNVSAVDCRLTELDISSVSGNASFSGAFSDIDSQSVSGDMEFVCTAVPQKIETENVSGKVDVTLPADAEFTATLDAVSGEMSSEFPCSVSKDRLICGSGVNRFEFQSVSGDVRILMAK